MWRLLVAGAPSLLAVGAGHVVGVLAARREPQGEPRRAAGTRWFAAHAAVNAVLAAWTVPALVAVAADPWRALDAGTHAGRMSGSAHVMRTVVALHVYHAVAYPMSAADVFHHAVFVGLLAVPGCAWDWGALGNAQVFFVCGLPGGVTYALLAARARFPSAAAREPAWTAWLTTRVRLPGALACQALLALLVVAGAPRAVPAWAAAVQVGLGAANAVYYAVASTARAERARRRSKAE